MAFSIKSVESQTTQISNIFIDEYMPKAHPPYVLVYLYAYCHVSSGDTSLSNQSIAEALDLLESDVVRSWKYWQKQGLIELSEDGNIHFLTVQSKKEQIKQQPLYHKTNNPPPQYTPEEMIAISTNSPTAKKLFSLAEHYLGDTLKYEDMTIVLGFNEWLQLSLEVIELLFSYCTDKNKSKKPYPLSYIEKIAISWANDGINTPERALEYIKLHQNGYKQIMRALGQNNFLTPAQEKYIKKWTSEYHFSVEMIVLACEKTILKIGKPDFTYINSIIEDWHKKNIKTSEEAEIDHKNFRASKENKKTEQKAQQKKSYQNTAVKQNRFVNYEQRQWDFEELERLARERLKKS